jgi:hypothetical protein
MPPAAPPAAAAAEDMKGSAVEDLINSGAAVLATPALTVRISRNVESAGDGASLRQVCKQAAASLDWFDLMWCARAEIFKVQAAAKYQASITVPAARIRRMIESSLSELWSCPPLLKWVVLQAAKQGDAELLGVVLGKQQQQQEVLQHEGSLLLEREQQQQSQRERVSRNEKQFCKAFLRHGIMLEELEYPPVLYRIASGAAGDLEGCSIWLTVIAAEEVVRSGQLKLLEHMLQQGWFQPIYTLRQAFKCENFEELNEMMSRPARSSVEQQLGPAFLAAAAARDVEAGKMLLNYCPELLDYALWTRPDHILGAFISMKVTSQCLAQFFREFETGCHLLGPFLDVLPFVSQLHRAGFTNIHLKHRVSEVLTRLCYHSQRHLPHLVQMLLDLGLVSCDEDAFYRPGSKDFGHVESYFETCCPIIGVAVAEHNAGAVAVLVAAGAVLPEPGERVYDLPFNYRDLQEVVAELEEQVAADGGDGGGVIGAAQYQKAADVLKGYCEEHGRERLHKYSWYITSITHARWSWKTLP